MISKNHPVIKKIEESDNITGEEKLLALASIDIISRTPHKFFSPYGWFDKNAEDIDEMFEWDDTDLGSNFWSNIQDKVFVENKRTC